MPEAQKTLTPETAPFEPGTIVPRQRLRRALADPEVLDEFLVNPKDVAERFNVSLTEDETAAVRNASHFMASWDFYCGEGQWLESARIDGRSPSRSLSIADMTTERVRARVAEEILQEMPEAIHRLVSELGAAALVDPAERLDDLPEHIQPLARTLRRLTQKMTREVTRELSQAPIAQLLAQLGMQRSGLQQAGLQQPGVQQPMAPGSVSQANADGITALGQALGQQLQEVVNHAAEEAVEHIRPPIARQQRWRAPLAQARYADQETQ